jgi:N-acetyl-gamma-glutamyl-phosphate/LysW-gamma-L-alpha-aminoadipyl-6-phosphate reductase
VEEFMIRVGIIGASGYTGGELLRLLALHPDVQISFVTSDRHVGEFVHRLHPNLKSVLQMKFTPRKNLEQYECDVTFCATPHGASKSYVPGLIDSGIKIIDLSADFRLKNPEKYEEYYKFTHPHPELLRESVYGIAELYRDEIKKARLVACPGCMAASAILSLAPIVKKYADYIDLNRIVIDSKIGSSAAGSIPLTSTHHPERAGVVRPYKPTGHRHSAEIEQELQRMSNKPLKVSLSPHAVDIIRGILSTSYVFLDHSEVEITESDIWKCYRDFYRTEPFIRFIKDKKGLYRYPDPKNVTGTNYCDLGFEIESRGFTRLVLFSAIDNLVKGAAGPAVQSMNLMFGIEETTALTFPGLHP